MRPVPQIALNFLKQAEGLRPSAYRDAAGLWTVGYGHRIGSDVGAISQAQADSYLYADAVKAAMRLSEVVRPEVLASLSDAQYAALVSFVFNLGCDPKWTLWAQLNASKLDCIPVQMMRFDKARLGGQLVEVPGLFNRRAAEVAMWKTGGASGEPPPSSYTAAVSTPPTPMALKSLSRSKTFITGCITACATVAAAAQDGLKSVKDAVQPYAADSTVLQGLVSHLALVSAALAVVTVAFGYLKNRNTAQ